MRSWLANAADGAAILLFTAVGRASHAEGVTVTGVLEVAWPFLVGGALGTLGGRVWRNPTDWAAGLSVWAGALFGGLLLRAWTGSAVPISFAGVTAVTLVVLLVGWRVTYVLVRSRRGRASDPHDQHPAVSGQ